MENGSGNEEQNTRGNAVIMEKTIGITPCKILFLMWLKILLLRKSRKL
jgi:hypothetical protein